MPSSKFILFGYNSTMPLTADQEKLIKQDIKSKVFLQGPAGSGKTTAGIHWLTKLIKAGIPPHQILIFTPQRTLSLPYQNTLYQEEVQAHGPVNSLTLGGLARRMVDLFWPLVGIDAGFGTPNKAPNFLTLETAQYYMAHLVRPLIEEKGLFDSLTINRNRIYAQILDNLNKAAVVGFPYEEIGGRLKSAWVGDIEQLHIYDDVQFCADQFRSFCLENNLLDFSLQVEVFLKHLWTSPMCRSYLSQFYRHLIVDNIEEDTPVTHDILKEWLPDFESALIIFDQEAGYRSFLGADVESAQSLKDSCDKIINFEKNLVSEDGIRQVSLGINNAIARLKGTPQSNPEPSFEAVRAAIVSPAENPKYFPGMVAWVADQIANLINDG
ncbi:MAG: hypothetical protein SCH68_03150, partial [Brevefilum sp.]|nr:hypothetical protein [Brevefilum sp.]